MFPNTILELRNVQKMSQQALAAKVGTSPAVITFIEKHQHFPGEDLRRRIATALEVTPEEVWPGLDQEG